jgi:hypothetical protein
MLSLYEAKSRHVVLPERAVPGRGPFDVDQRLTHEEAGLRGGDVSRLLAQTWDFVVDGETGSGSTHLE